MNKKKSLLSLCTVLLLAANLAANEKQEDSLGEITVTGEKMDRSLFETTTAISVIDEDDINKGNYKTVEGLINQVPNAVLSPFGVPNIRGVDGEGVSKGVRSLLAGARPRVTTTIDGVSESWTGVNYISGGLWDVEQVEVLRGAQSTTQGRNSIGGAVVMKTIDPTFDFEGKVKAGYESAQNKNQLAAVVSGPIIDDELAFRLAVDRNEGESFIKYKNFGFEDKVKKAETTNIRAKFLYAPKDIEDLTVKFGINHRKAEGGYLNYVNNNYEDYELDGSVTRTNTRYQDSQDTAYSLDIDYQLSADLALQTLLSYKDYNAKFEQRPSILNMDLEETSSSLESKLVYDSSDSNLSGVLGLYLYERKQDLSVQPNNVFKGDDSVKTAAIFTDGTIGLNDKLDLVLGARLERESQKRDLLAWEASAWEGTVKTDEEETVFLPKIGFSYKVTDNNIVSLIAKKGYSPGGGSLNWNTSEFYTYDKEEVNTIELTTRNKIADESILLNTNLFYNDYKGYQTDLGEEFVNLPKVKTYGIELEAVAELSPEFTLFGSIGLLKSKISQSVSSNPELNGNKLGTAPAHNISLGFKHQVNTNLSWGADVTKTSKYYSNIENNDSVGDYTIANVNAMYEYKDFTFRTYVNNLTDELVVYRKTTSNTAQVGAPRTIGASVEYKF